MKKIKFAFALLLLFAVPCVFAQDLLFKKAPPLTLKALLQSPQRKLKESDLMGKVVVLEFWATWCTPCMANLPHLNKLNAEFAGKKVVFISITDEPEDKVNLFLHKRKMNGWIGIDSNFMTNKSYGIEGWPATIVIDANGMVEYAGEPTHLTEEVLSGILSGSYVPVKRKIKEEEVLLGGWSGGDDPVLTAHFKQKCLYQHTIRPSVMGTSKGYGYGQGKGKVGISLLGQSLPEIICFTEELASPKRVINLSNVPDSAKWDVIFSRSKGYDMPKALRELNSSLEETFAISVGDTVVTARAYIPVYKRSSKIVNEKSMNFDDPSSHTYHSIKEIFDRMEAKTEQIVDYPAGAANDFIDLFPVLKAFYNMSGEEIKSWLETEGVSFREEKSDIKMKVLHNNVL